MKNKKLIKALDSTRQLLNKLDHKKKKMQRMEAALEAAIAILTDIRYRDWKDMGVGALPAGLTAEKFDEVIMEAEAVLPKNPRKKKER